MSLALFDNGPPKPCPAPFNLARYVLTNAGADPDKPALEIVAANTKQTWTYRELEGAVLRVAGGLREQNLPDNARILLRLGNVVEFPILFLAAITAGYQPVPSSSSLTAPELQVITETLKPDLVIRGAGIEMPEVKGVRILEPKETAGLFQHAPVSYDMRDPNRPAYIIFTSGTSGKPQGVVHAHRAVWARRMMWRDWCDLGPGDRLMHAGAFNWTYTLGTGLMDPWAMGATAQIPAQESSSAGLIDLMRAHKTTIFAASPGVYRQILKQAKPVELPDLRHGLSAGEKLPPALKDAWQRKTGRPVFEALGMSEVSTYVSASPLHENNRKSGSFPQQGRRVAILDPSGEILPTGCAGILALSNRDPGLMLEYLNAPDATSERYLGEWFLTGDMAEMAENGAITYLGRRDDMMNAGGFRVSPIEVETVLNAHPDILESAAAMVEIKANAFVIAAFYQSGVDLDKDELAQWCKTRLARYKCPRVFQRLETLPKGANNKIRRKDLRRSFRGENDPA